MIVARSAVVIVLLVVAYSSDSVFVSNLTPICLRCLCHAASSCNQTLGCIDGFCGPFQINRLYWRDAGHYVPPEDDPSRENAFLDCAMDYTCAQHILEEYFIRYGSDCNRDGVTDCDDYAMLHFNLKEDCRSSLDGTNFGRRYSTCRPTSKLPGDTV
ncbi:lysozyme 2-like isoform X2 [Macrosteles quadrilineatus]|uniref:lysozyme 2-like isoform X2 n=1 Tax=Macrosteles quadrilineatus TaxID=74068 RepID=UPI0023E11B9D|nr:lysozyme 2-like isoform X2 [Macrosteles quadrilineatus]